MSNFDTNCFIIEVECIPVLLYQERSPYSNRHLKFKTWEEVASAMYLGYNLNKGKEVMIVTNQLLFATFS